MVLLRGRGVLKAKILKAKYDANLGFLGWRGVQNKKSLLWRVYRYFLELHINKIMQ